MPVAAGIVGVALGPDWKLGIGLMLFAALVPVGQVIAWWTDLIHVSRRVMPQQKKAIAFVEMLLPFLWIALGALILFGLPLVIAGIALAIISLA